MGMVLVIVGSLALGIRIAGSMKGRVADLKEIDRILGYIEGELRCKHSMLAEALYNVSRKTKEPYSSWLFSLMSAVEGNGTVSHEAYGVDDFYSMWCKSLDELRPTSNLTSKDICQLYDVGKALGYLDIESQQMNLNLEREHIRETISELDKDIGARMKNAVVLCFLGGIMTVIALL